jgi:hypothetical protein
LEGKVKTKHDITWFAQKTNVGFVDQLNPSTHKTVAESKIKKNIFLLFTPYTVIGECCEDEDGFHYSISGCTAKIHNLDVKFLSSDEEN